MGGITVGKREGGREGGGERGKEGGRGREGEGGREGGREGGGERRKEREREEGCFLVQAHVSAPYMYKHMNHLYTVCVKKNFP